MTKQSISLIGYASSVAGMEAPAFNCGLSPSIIQHSSYLTDVTLDWQAMLNPSASTELAKEEIVAEINTELAKQVSSLLKQQKKCCVIGGDHTCALGTWSGVYDALNQKGNVGLIWIDAHMDSHTPATTETGRLHGMPLACLLGYGDSRLTSILHAEPKIKPRNLCLIGVRSFEKAEELFLAKLGVRIYFMPEIKQRGFSAVLQEAVTYVSADTINFGLSIDIDAIDPRDAAGVGVPEAGGIRAEELLEGLLKIVANPKYIATEVAEFDSSRDVNRATEKVVTDIVKILI